VAGAYLRDCAPLRPSAQASSALFADRVWRHAEQVCDAALAGAPRA